MAPSKTAKERYTSAKKSMWPGVSTMLTLHLEKRFGSLSQEDRRTKLLGHLLRSDGVMLMPGWTVSAEAATEQEVAAFCGKRQVRIF